MDFYNFNTDTDDYRTTVYGFPCLVFHEKSTGEFEFIGKYNFKLVLAYFLVKDGRLNGGNKAYDLKFRWGRIKKLREFVIPYDAPTLLQMAYEVADIDAKVKNGKLEKEKVIDYIICLII